MGRICSTNEGNISRESSKEERPLRTPRLRWEDNIKTDIK